MRDEDVDLLVQDIMRPGGSGFELCGILKGDKQLSRIPVMIVSGWRDVIVDRLSLVENGPNNRYRLTFIVSSSFAGRAVLSVAGYLKLPMAMDAFVPMVEEILECHCEPR